MWGSCEWRWLLFSALIGLNQGAVTLTLALASSIVGVRHAGIESGVLFASYTLSALLLAVPMVRALSSKWAAVVSLTAQGAYVGSYCIASFVDGAAALGVCLVGSVIGGLASGCLWTAQGAHFALHARAVAQKNERAEEHVHAALASQFAATFLLVEVAVKLASFLAFQLPPVHKNASSAVAGDSGGARMGVQLQQLLLALLTVVTVVCGASSAYVLVDLRPWSHVADDATGPAQLPSPGGTGRGQSRAGSVAPVLGRERPRWLGRLGAALVLLREPQALLLAPFNVAFACCSSLLTNYVDAAVTPSHSLARALACSSSNAPRDSDRRTVRVERRPLPNAQIARPVLGLQSVPIFAALLSAVAAAGAFCFGAMSRRFGSISVLCSACVCFLSHATYLAAVEATCMGGGGEHTNASGSGGRLSMHETLVLVQSHDAPGEDECASARHDFFGWSELSVVYALQGLGRGAWESINRAVWAERFPACADAAFAALLLQFGLASTFAYIAFPHLPPLHAMIICACASVLAAVGCVIADGQHKRGRENMDASGVDCVEDHGGHTLTHEGAYSAYNGQPDGTLTAHCAAPPLGIGPHLEGAMSVEYAPHGAGSCSLNATLLAQPMHVRSERSTVASRL